MSHWITDSLDSFKQLIHSETKQVTVFNGWVTDSLTHSVRSNSWFILKQSKWLSLWMIHWFIDSLDSFKQLIHSETKQVTVFNGWVTDSLTHSVRSNSWFIQKQSKWLSLWMSHWFIDSLDSFKQLIHSETKQVTVFNGWVTESLTHSVRSNSWFILKQSKSLWMSHWITDSLSSFKQLIHSKTKQVTCLYEWVTDSLTHLIHSKFLIHSVKS